MKEKDIALLREGDQTKLQRDKRQGDLRDYSMRHKVGVRWDLNAEAMKDKMFELTIDDYTVILDWEEILRYGRWI